MIKVSVILTTYNSEKSIERVLDSILNQEGLDKEFSLELIVVDDCSTDKTPSLLRNKCIRFYTTSYNTGGPNKGRNIGLEHATGDFICFADHDDVWEPDKLLHQLKAVRYAPIVSTLYRVVDITHHKTSMPEYHMEEPRIYLKNETFLDKLARNGKGQATYLSTLMISRELKNIRFEENFGMVDYDWLLRILENRSSVQIPRFMVTRYVSGFNLSLNNEYRKNDYYYSMMTLESYEKKYPRQVAMGLKKINGTRARYFYLTGDMRAARKYLKRSLWNIKAGLYYLTSFYGDYWVRKNFRFFG